MLQHGRCDHKNNEQHQHDIDQWSHMISASNGVTSSHNHRNSFTSGASRGMRLLLPRDAGTAFEHASKSC